MFLLFMFKRPLIDLIIKNKKLFQITKFFCILATFSLFLLRNRPIKLSFLSKLNNLFIYIKSQIIMKSTQKLYLAL
jgi:hypothetical protein